MKLKRILVLVAIVSTVVGGYGITSTNKAEPTKATFKKVAISENEKSQTEDTKQVGIVLGEETLGAVEQVKDEITSESKTSSVVSSDNTSASTSNTTSNQQPTSQQSSSSNSSSSNTNSNTNQNKVEQPSKPIESKPEVKPEVKPTEPEVVKPQEEVKNYQIGNCGVLYNTESEAYAAADKKFDDFSDPTKYVSSYLVYSTYDKWSINYYYTYW
ncbi:MAG: hypothetical protein PHC59_14895 [Thomasclavelia ramosa]|nr:hypothetical protein [Thomasclavelia ramosa]